MHKKSFHVLNYKECVFNGIGDRVAQLFDVELVVPPEDRIHKLGMRTILVNTHLVFPHDYRYCFARLKQVYFWLLSGTKLCMSLASICPVSCALLTLTFINI